ncbi:Crp/Fnr family transcriptional regulator [Achromobacter sp. F4_2707]|uniref:Crp/Fnr family transcriptional regulator n=1 Tax=Achromobacter sp. F4_2707 TaxID=3114286 RepID=UPI0039C68571
MTERVEPTALSGFAGREARGESGMESGVDKQGQPLLELLARVRSFQGLDPAALHLLSEGAILQTYEPGEVVFREGDTALAYFLVVEGEVDVLRYSITGEERVFFVFDAGKTVAEAAMFMPHGRYPMYVRARTVARLYRLRRDKLLAACRNYPDLSMQMLALLSQTIYVQVNKVDWFSSSSAAERLANYLLGLKPCKENKVCLPLSQRQLAAHLGVRAETLCRLLTDWQAKGYVAGRRNEWELRDRAYLQDLASAAQRSF